MEPEAEIRIRRAAPDDAVLVRTMAREIAAHQGSADDVAADVDDWRQALTRPDVQILLAFDGEHPVGYTSTTRRFHLWSASDVIALDDLYVRPAARNRGVGRVLMHAVAGIAAPEGLTVTWGAQPDNVDAHRFYERLGAEMRTKTLFTWKPTPDDAAGTE